MEQLSDVHGLQKLDKLWLCCPWHRGRPTLESFWVTPEDIPWPPSLPSLTSLTLSTSMRYRDPTDEPQITRAFLSRETLRVLRTRIDFRNLTRLAFLGVYAPIRLSMLERLPNLEELYIHIKYPTTLFEMLNDSRACKGRRPLLPKLRILHLNKPCDWRPMNWPKVTDWNLVPFALVLDRLEQVGAVEEVFEVHRRRNGNHDNIRLAPWSKAELPGFQRL